MNDIEKALDDLSSIRRQMARSTEFRGYGPVALAVTAALALAAAGAQSIWLPDPSSRMSAYLGLWIGTAFLAVGLIAAHTYARTRRVHSPMADDMAAMAVEHFLPSIAAGALITIILVRRAPGTLWLLPGLWQVIFSLGVFASSRFLPRPVMLVGVWYLVTGLICISLADIRALSPWAMGVPFGIGQALVAAILLPGTKSRRQGRER